MPQFYEAAARGEELFEIKANCASGHPAPWYTGRQASNARILTPQEINDLVAYLVSL